MIIYTHSWRLIFFESDELRKILFIASFIDFFFDYLNFSLKLIHDDPFRLIPTLLGLVNRMWTVFFMSKILLIFFCSAYWLAGRKKKFFLLLLKFLLNFLKNHFDLFITSSRTVCKKKTFFRIPLTFLGQVFFIN